MTNRILAYHKYNKCIGALSCFLISMFWLTSVVSAECTYEEKRGGVCVSEDKPYLTKEFTLENTGTLKAYTIAGNIEVQTIENSDKVRVELYLDRGYSFWSNSKSLDNYRITILQRGSEIIASVERKDKETGFFSDQMRFSYKLYVPKKISTELKTSRGNVSISGMKGKHLIKSSGGNIDLENITGKATAYTAGGNINISNSNGILYAKTTGGNITIDQSQGEIRVQSNAGQVIAERVSGTLLAQLGAGDIKAHFLCITEGISLDTGNGNIYLELPAMDGFELVLGGSQIRLPSTWAFQGERSQTRVEGTVSGGGVPINLTTSHGNIEIKQD